MKRYVVEEQCDTSRSAATSAQPPALGGAADPTTTTTSAAATTTAMDAHATPIPPRAFLAANKDGAAPEASSTSSPPKMGLLARYSRWSHDRPWTGFGVILAVVLIMTTVVGAANLAQFNTDDSDKVRARAVVLYSITPETRFFFFFFYGFFFFFYKLKE